MRTNVITFILAMMCSISAFAQQDSFDKLLAAISSESAAFDYSFSTSGPVKMTGSGKVTVQDKCFRVDGKGLEIWSDGKSVWTIDRAAKEAIIEDAQDSSVDVANPAQFLSVAESAFTRQLTTSSMVVLVPKGKSEIKQIKMYMKDAAKPILSKVSVTVSDGTETEFIINNMKYSKKNGTEAFVPDMSSLSSDFIVTDLR